MFWKILIGLCTMVMLSSCSYQLVISDMFLVYGTVIFVIDCTGHAVVGSVVKHFLIKLLGYWGKETK